MGFWSALGSIAGIAAAPFTGGLSLIPSIALGAGTGALTGGWKGALLGGALGAVPGAGAVAGKLGNGIWGKVANAGINMGKNVLKQGVGNVAGVAGNVAGGIEAGREAGRKRGADNASLAQKYGDNAYNMALRSALAKNIQDFSVAPPPGVHMGTITGGARPSAIGPEGRQAADVMNAQALRQLMSSGQYTLPDDLNGNGVDTVLGTIATAGKAIGGAQATQQQNTEQGLIQQILAEARKGTSSTDPVAKPVPYVDPNFDPNSFENGGA